MRDTRRRNRNRDGSSSTLTKRTTPRRGFRLLHSVRRDYGSSPRFLLTHVFYYVESIVAWEGRLNRTQCHNTKKDDGECTVLKK
jgi:hypothetical protein